MTKPQRCRFCGRRDGVILTERREGLRIRRGVAPIVTAQHHQECLDAFAENEARLRAESLAELQAQHDAIRAEMGIS